MFSAAVRAIRSKGTISLLGASWLAMGTTSSSENADSKLLLYSHHHSYYARKVLLTLEEKRVPYKVRRMEIMKGEQYDPWFIKINPRGEIPVLQDGSTIVIDSMRIIDYLNDGFSQGEFINLVPDDVPPSVREKIAELRSAVDAIEGNMIQFGLLYHPEYLNDADKHYPYSLPGIATAMKSSVDEMPSKLRSLVEKYPENKDVLLGKAASAEKTKTTVQSKELFHIEMQALDALFATLEGELAASGSEAPWLTGARFTQADVSLAILMDRLWRLGAAERVWGRHPHLKRYFERLQDRASYKAIDTSLWDDLPSFAAYIAIAAGIIIALIVGLVCLVVFLVRKYSNK